MKEWRTVTLGDVIQLQRGFDLTEKQASRGNVPVFSSGGISYFTGEPKCQGPGVITGRKGVLGKVHYSPGEYWPHDTTLWVKDFKDSWPRFIYYLLQTLPLAALDAGASNPTLNRNHVHLLPVRVPPLHVQKRIAEVLGTLDDLIENNLRRVELLDQMARAIYREWFVHFRYPGHEKDKLVDSPLGPIPDGWRACPASELFDIDKGVSYKGALLDDEGTPMVNLKCFSPSGGFRFEGLKGYAGEVKPWHMVSGGDLVMANADLTQAGTIIGRVASIPVVDKYSEFVMSHHVFAVRPKTLPTVFLLYALGEERFRRHARSVASGTTVLGLRREDVKTYSLIIPPWIVIEPFVALADDCRAIQESLDQAGRQLRCIRDALLPRLVTGQIDVSMLNLDAVLEGAIG